MTPCAASCAVPVLICAAEAPVGQNSSKPFTSQSRVTTVPG